MTRPETPDTGTRILIATIALILLLAYLLGGHGIWTGEPFP